MSDPDEQYHALLREALVLLKVSGKEEEKERAKISIESVARNFRSRLGSLEGSPKFTDLRKQLDDISKRARELTRLLEQVWPHVHAAAAGYCSVDDWVSQEGSSFYEQLIDSPEKARTALPKIADAVDKILRRLPNQRGGERNVEARFHGLPKELLAVQCWEIFHYYRPHEATAAVDGEYHRFTEVIYELAIGEHPKWDAAGLERYVKNAAVFCRDLLKRRPAIERLWRAEASDGPPIGLLSESGVLADYFGIPQRLRQEISREKE